MALVASTVLWLLVPRADIEDAGMVVGGAEAAADVVGQAQFGADVLDDAGAEAAGEDLVHDVERVVVGVVFGGAEADDVDGGLVDVVLGGEVDAGGGPGEADLGSHDDFALGEWLEGGAELCLHGRRVEVARDGEDHVVGDDGALVPLPKVVEGDGLDGGVLGLAAVGGVFAVDQLPGDASGDPAGIVVATGDAGFGAALGELQLVLLEVGVEQDLGGDAEDGVEVALQAGPADGGGGLAAAGLDGGGFGVKLLIERVATDGGGAAGAPGAAVERDQAGLGGGFVARAAANEDAAIDERKLVILLEKDDEAVGQLDAPGHDRGEGVERRDGDMLPRLGGGVSGRGLGEACRRGDGCAEDCRGRRSGSFRTSCARLDGWSGCRGRNDRYDAGGRPVALDKDVVSDTADVGLADLVDLVEVAEHLAPVAEAGLVFGEGVGEAVVVCQAAEHVGFGSGLVALELGVGDVGGLQGLKLLLDGDAHLVVGVAGRGTA